MRTLLLQNGTRRLSLSVELELEERPPWSWKRVSERARSATSGLFLGFTNSLSASRRKIAVNPDAALYSPT